MFVEHVDIEKQESETMIPQLTRAKVIVITAKEMMEWEGVLSKRRVISGEEVDM